MKSVNEVQCDQCINATTNNGAGMPKRSFLALFVLWLMTLFNSSAWALNTVQMENAKPIPNYGSDAIYKLPQHNWTWSLSHPPANYHDIEGYADKASVHLGAAINFYTSVNPALDPDYTLIIYRLGWYQGQGARPMTNPIILKSVARPMPTPDPVTGLLDAGWEVEPACTKLKTCDYKYTLNVPWSWVSGVYVAALVGNTTKTGQFIPFVVKNDTHRSAYVFQTSDTTWQAYNAWGGKSLYGYNSIGGIPATKVSYNRPFDGSYGAGSLFAWELQMLRFLEREGYDVTYQSNVDTHIGGMWQLSKHKAFLSVGHDEYWTRPIRSNIENSKLRGLSVGFFGANAGYWQMRFESSASGGVNRTIVCYKDEDGNPLQDPLALDTDISNNILITRRWRDSRYWNAPENGLIGIMYVADPVKSDMLMTNTNHWVFKGTGLTNGAALTGLLGYEVDGVVNNGKTPTNLQILAHTPFTLASGKTGFANMSIYSEACSLPPCTSAFSTVFATGSMYWNYGLDSFLTGRTLENVAAQKITRNVLARLVGDPLPVQ